MGMKDIVSYFLLIIVLTIFYIYLENKSLFLDYVKSDIDGKKYLVRDVEDKKEAAHLMARLNINLKKIIEYMNNKENRKKNSDKVNRDIDRLVSNYSEAYISESSPGNKHTSYSINKGDKMVFCIRSKKDNKLIDLNTLTFVAIHELAHLMTETIGHDETFWENMRIILRNAIKINLYTPQNFADNPVPYCGIEITDTPLKD